MRSAIVSDWIIDAGGRTNCRGAISIAGRGAMGTGWRNAVVAFSVALATRAAPSIAVAGGNGPTIDAIGATIVVLLPASVACGVSVSPRRCASRRRLARIFSLSRSSWSARSSSRARRALCWWLRTVLSSLVILARRACCRSLFCSRIAWRSCSPRASRHRLCRALLASRRSSSTLLKYRYLAARLLARRLRRCSAVSFSRASYAARMNSGVSITPMTSHVIPHEFSTLFSTVHNLLQVSITCFPQQVRRTSPPLGPKRQHRKGNHGDNMLKAAARRTAARAKPLVRMSIVRRAAPALGASVRGVAAPRSAVERCQWVRMLATSTPSQPLFPVNKSQVASVVVGIATAAGMLYFLVVYPRQSEEKKQQKALEKEQERQLSARLAAELVAAEAKHNSVDWKATLERVVPAIVSLKLNNPKFFDTESPGNGSATGFVVDAERGIILTNRHVVGPGPIDAEAVFQNNEEVRVIPIYRDPVHDFGFFKYSPTDVKHIKVPSLPLNPEKASVGTDIRVVGNDAAEKLAIASGTLARLDRDAPNYGFNSYNDFNTFYFQASSGTTGGSSGSPVLNHDGEAVALNAGGKIGTAASFYLPLDRVKRALELIQKGEDVPRGTIQTVFHYKPFDEVRRLGVTSETESLVRSTSPLETGMLVVAETVPGGPSHKTLEPGDILVRVNGELVTRFVPLEAILDDNVDKSIEVEFERSGKLIKKTMQVQDLHAITPSRFLEIGGAVINPLSYQQARNHTLTPGTPYVADPGYFLQRSHIGRGAIIRSVNGVPTPDLDALKKFLINTVDGERVVIKYSMLSEKSERVEVVHIDRRWFPFCEYVRDDKEGTWHSINLDDVAATKTVELKNDQPPKKNGTRAIGSTTTLPGKNKIEAKLAHSLVTVDYDRPFSVNSLATANYRGTGLVIDAEKGLVVVDRNTVTDSLGDAMVTFASTIMVPAQVVFVHPVHNFAIVQYDPKLIGSTPIESCKISKKKIEPSDPVWLVGLISSVGRSGHSDLVSRETIVSGVKWIGLPMPSPPRYQEHNLEMVALQDVVTTEGGVVTDPEGEVQAFWGSFSYQQRRNGGKVESQFSRGIPIDIIMDSAKPLMEGKTPELWDLGVDFEQISLAKARELGLEQSLAEVLERDAPDRRTILSVVRSWGGTEASKVLNNGDILVAVDDKIVTSFREVEKCCQKPQVTLTIVRDGEEKRIDVKTLLMERTEINRIVFWQGLLLQAPPLSVSAQRSISLDDGVYVSCRYSGSPAARYGPPPTSRIKEIDGVKITSIDDFINVVKAKAGSDSVRIKYTDLTGKDRLSTLKLEPKYWPTRELLHENGEWHRREIH